MTKGFEHSTDDVVYNWVYRFDKNQSKKDLDFYFSDSSFEINNGIFIYNHDLRTMIPYIALLSVNDVFLNAVMNFNSSMQLSYTCLFCELSEKENKMHPSHEPKVWEKLALYSNYETAIVLACRSVENILGKPPKKDKVGSVEKFKTKWLTMLNLDPDDHFKKGNCTYFDFYYRLFIMRNDSAHANYKRTFDLERKNTIESQCFAALILSDYALKNIQNFQDSCHSLNVNTKIIK